MVMPSPLPQSPVSPLRGLASTSQPDPYGEPAKTWRSSLPVSARVHPVVAHLAQRFAGWHTDYTGEDIDWGMPDSGEMALLPIALAALLSTGVMDWAALDPKTGAHWDPFVESYWTFRARHPDARVGVQSSPARWEALATFLESFGLVQRV